MLNKNDRIHYLLLNKDFNLTIKSFSMKTFSDIILYSLITT